ncbi:hypothetical protein SCUCBS95973_007994 [Sporothrix curviconia]|uniref:Zn(2)-C6 fungal-type domain-containing protein n=1 Tax=Sporothrix curviconia TaxID=1260050 RepID=A0ABP0CIH5_9PEZI
MAQIPSPSDGSAPRPGSHGRPAKRPRVLVACQRCKARRQRCDNGSPACGNCARATTACLYSDRTAYPPSYVKALEERVRELEARQGSVTSPERQNTPAGDRLVTGMGLLSSCAAAEPHYFGFSAGLSLAHFVQVALDFGSVTSADVVSLPLLTDRPFANQALHQKSPNDAVPAAIPSQKTGAAYIRAYLQLIHPLYPFLDKQQLWYSHRQTRDRPTDLDPMDAALLHLVYAIGARCLQLAGTTASASSTAKNNTHEGHFLRAMQIIGEGLQFTSIRSIELTLLLAIHSMRSPSGTSVWHLAGLALRQCIELGLHRPRPDDTPAAVAANPNTTASTAPPTLASAGEHRKRLFWSAYIFERKTALVLGRPFALADEEIDVHLPAGDDVRFHCAHVELYQLHSQIRYVLHQMKQGGTSASGQQDHRPQLRDTMERLFSELDAWKARVLQTFNESRNTWAVDDRGEGQDGSSSPSTGAAEPDSSGVPSVLTQQTELLLEFYKARRSLLQPLMTEGRSIYPFDTADYAACADASGQICQLYRRLHRLAPVPFSLRDLHAIFVAGFTLIYAICSAPSLYTAAGSTCARDIGACSTLLYVITEQWASAKKYRDAFEVVAEKMEASAARYTEPAVCGSASVERQPALSVALVPSIALPYGPTPVPPQPATSLTGFEQNVSSGIELDLESDMYGIEGLLYSEGLDWFTEAVL